MTRYPAIELIAQKTLRMDTLQTRDADILDFYDLAVWQIRQALSEAYEEGRKSNAK